MADIVYRIAGNVQIKPLRAITFRLPSVLAYDDENNRTDYYFTYFNIESGLNWSLTPRIRKHSRKGNVNLGYTFTGEFAFPYNDSFGQIFELDLASSQSFQKKLNGFIRSAGTCILTFGNATPPNMNESDCPPQLNATSGSYLVLTNYSLVYEIKSSEGRYYVNVKISSELKQSRPIGSIDSSRAFMTAAQGYWIDKYDIMLTNPTMKDYLY